MVGLEGKVVVAVLERVADLVAERQAVGLDIAEDLGDSFLEEGMATRPDLAQFGGHRRL